MAWVGAGEAEGGRARRRQRHPCTPVTGEDTTYGRKEGARGEDSGSGLAELGHGQSREVKVAARSRKPPILNRTRAVWSVGYEKWITLD